MKGETERRRKKENTKYEDIFRRMSVSKKILKWQSDVELELVLQEK